jgi:hypothetical protein
MKSNLIRLSLFALICLVSVATVMATPTCPTDPMATTYVPSNGAPPSSFVCDIGSLQFSNFTYSSAVLDPTNVNVVPITTPGFEGLAFNGVYGVGKNGQPANEDVFVSFTVTALQGQLTDIHIDLSNVNATGTGLVDYTEQFCNLSGTCQLEVFKPGTSLSTSIDLVNTALGGPQTTLNITKDVALSAGSNGTASMSGFDNYYSHSVPEPRTVSLLLCGGFLGIVAFMKRRQAVRS